MKRLILLLFFLNYIVLTSGQTLKFGYGWKKLDFPANDFPYMLCKGKDSTVYIGVTTGANQERHAIRKYDGDNFIEIATYFPGIRAMCFGNNKLYVGGIGNKIYEYNDSSKIVKVIKINSPLITELAIDTVDNIVYAYDISTRALLRYKKTDTAFIHMTDIGGNVETMIADKYGDIYLAGYLVRKGKMNILRLGKWGWDTLDVTSIFAGNSIQKLCSYGDHLYVAMGKSKYIYDYLWGNGSKAGGEVSEAHVLSNDYTIDLRADDSGSLYASGFFPDIMKLRAGEMAWKPVGTLRGLTYTANIVPVTNGIAYASGPDKGKIYKYCLGYFPVEDTIVVTPPPDTAQPPPAIIGIYPNPTRGLVTLNLPTINTGAYVLLNPIGQVCQKGIIETMPKTLNLSDLASGLYFLHCSNGRSVYKIIRE